MPTQSQDRLSEVLQDPEFLNLPPEERLKVIRTLDSDFGGLPEAEQTKALSMMLGGEPSLVPPPEAPPTKIPRSQALGAVQLLRGMKRDYPGQPEALAKALQKPLLRIAEGMTAIKRSFIGSQTGISFDEEEDRYILAGDPNEVIYTSPATPKLAFTAKMGFPPAPPTEVKRFQAEAALNTIVDLGQLSAETIEMLSTPVNVGILGLMAAAPEIGIPTIVSRVASLYFTKEMADIATRELREAYDLVREDKLLAAGRKFSSGVVTAVFALMAGTHAVKGKLGPKEVEKLANEEKWNAYDQNYPPQNAKEVVARSKTRAKGEPPPEVVRPEAPPEAVPPTKVEVPPPPEEPVGAILAGSTKKVQVVGATDTGGTIQLNTLGDKLTPADIKEFFSKYDVDVSAPKPAFSEFGRPGQTFRIDFFEEGLYGLKTRLSYADSKQALQEAFGGRQGYDLRSALQRQALEAPPTEKPPPLPEELRAPEAAQERIVEEVELLQQERVIEAQKGLLKIQAQLPKGMTVIPRQADLRPIIEERLGSPWTTFRKVSPAAGEIVDLTINATENIARNTAVAITEYERVWRPLDRGQEQATIKLLSNPEVTPENLSIRTDPKTRNAYIATRVMLDTQLERINEANVSVKLPVIEGIKKGYFPRVYEEVLGANWAVLKQTAEGKWTPIGAKGLSWLQPSQVEAINTMREYGRQNPGDILKVELKELNLTPPEATLLSRKGYFRLMNKLSKASELYMLPDGELVVGEVGRKLAQERLKGVARFEGKPTKRAPFGHIKQRRTNLEGWLEEPRALEILIRGAERYIEMTKLRPKVAKLRERVNEEAPGNVKAHTGAWRLQQQLDSYIDAAVLGRTDSVTASLNAGWELMGEKLGIVARPGMVQRYSSIVTQYQSLTKLGVNLVSPMVNLTQTVINTYPVLGAKYTSYGIRKFIEAYRDHLRGIPNEHWDLIERLNIPHQATKIEEATIREHFRLHIPRTAREIPKVLFDLVTDVGLLAFRGSEFVNRGSAAIGAYKEALDANKSPAERDIAARGVLTRAHFQYGISDASWVLRSALARVPLQFKTFLLKEFEFMLGLRGKEIPRFFGALALTTGVTGLPAIGALDAILEGMGVKIGGMSLLEYLRFDDPTEERTSIIPRMLQRGVAQGIPGALGVDFVRNVGFQDYFSPAMLEPMRLLLGPTGSDVGNLWNVAVTQLRSRVGPLLEGDIQTVGELARGRPSRKRDESLRVFITQTSPSMRRAWSVLSRLTHGEKREIRDPRTGKLIIEDITFTEKALILLGFAPTRVTSLQALERAMAKAVMEEKDVRAGFVDQLVNLKIRANNLDDEGKMEEATELRTRFDYLLEWADRLDVSPGILKAVVARQKLLEKTALERTREHAPRYMRRELEEFPVPPEE